MHHVSIFYVGCYFHIPVIAPFNQLDNLRGLQNIRGRITSTHGQFIPKLVFKRHRVQPFIFFSFNHSFKKCWLNAWHVVRRERKKKKCHRIFFRNYELEALMLWIKEFIVLLIIAVVKEFPPKCVLGEEAFQSNIILTGS